MDNICTIVLAAGRGIRMGSKLPKVLLNLCGRPLIFRTLDLIKDLGIKDVIVVTGYKSRLIQKKILEAGYQVEFAHQKKKKGTASSVRAGLLRVPESIKTIIVFFGDDSSLYQKRTIENLIKFHIDKGNHGSLLFIKNSRPTPLGSLKRDRNGNLIGVQTLSQMLRDKVKENEILCGTFVFNKDWLIRNIKLIKVNPLSGEYSLPSLIKIASEKDEYLKTYELFDHCQWSSVNSPDELKEARRKKSCKGSWEKNGK